VAVAKAVWAQVVSPVAETAVTVTAEPLPTFRALALAQITNHSLPTEVAEVVLVEMHLDEMAEQEFLIH
jgi:hypothetical protein